ncbi:MAG: lipopolysaccharide assembly protein LapB [Burkholderiaceae bacterium]
MDLDLVWLLLVALPLAFVLGWGASRFDLRQLRFDSRQAPKAYFKGLNYLLNEQQDQAIDAFIEAVQNDPDTSELHFALGNLFRRRGEFQRAVRVHEHLLSRGDLSADDHQRAQHALALDFLKAGVLDRAEEALRKLDGGPLEKQSLIALLAIFERSRDWEQAAVCARRLHTASDSKEGEFEDRIAHYLCEQAISLRACDEPAGRKLLERAVMTAPHAPRARIELAQWQAAAGESLAAFRTLKTLCNAAPDALPLAAGQFAQLASTIDTRTEALALLQTSYARTPSLDVLDAIVALKQATGAATTTSPSDAADAPRNLYVAHLDRVPSLVAAARWLADEKIEHEQFRPQLQRTLERATRPLTRYRCASCGFEASLHFWHCPGCQSWDSYSTRRVDEL